MQFEIPFIIIIIKFFILIGLNFTIVENASITVEQMRQLAEPVKLVCIPKTKVSEDALQSLSKRVLADQKELKCYVNCLLEMMQTMKKGKIQYEAVMKTIDTMLPDELRDGTRKAVESCKTAAVGIKDPCEASYTLLKCMFKEYPDFFIP